MTRAGQAAILPCAGSPRSPKSRLIQQAWHLYAESLPTGYRPTPIDHPDHEE